MWWQQQALIRSNVLSTQSWSGMDFRVRLGSKSVLKMDSQGNAMLHVVAQVERRGDTYNTTIC